MKEYKCVCGKYFKSKQALVGHYANCLHHKEDLKQRQQKEQEEKETRRLPNDLFPCDNPDCNKEHDGSYGSGRFCCKKCRDHYNALQSYQTKKKNGTLKSMEMTLSNYMKKLDLFDKHFVIAGILGRAPFPGS